MIAAIRVECGNATLVTVSEKDVSGYHQTETVSAYLPTFISRDALLAMLACLIDEAQRQVNERVRTANLTYARTEP